MRLIDLITEDRIVLNLQAEGRADVLRELVRRGLNSGDPFGPDDEDRIVGVLEAREQMGSTGIKGGLAIPHGKIAGLPSLVACVAVHNKGVPFGAMDEQNSRVFVVLLAPEGGGGEHLKALARVARLFSNGQLLPRLVNAESKSDALAAIAEQDAFLAPGGS